MKTTAYITPNINIDFQKIDITKGCDIKEMSKIMASYYNVHGDEIELFNGEPSLINAFFKYLFLVKKFNKKCYLYAPCTQGFEKILQQFTNNIEHINRFDNLLMPIIKNSLVIFSNPTTPDGKYYDIEPLLAFWQEKEATILIDETFFEYYEGKSAIEFVNSYDNLYIIKSMSHFYHMGGVKFATLISRKVNIDAIKQYEVDKKLSVFDTMYVKAVLKDKNFKRISQAIHAKNILLLEEVLKCSALFEVIHSTNTNFVLAKLKIMKGRVLKNLLEKEGVDMMHYDDITFLGESYVGFKVHSEGCVKKLIEAFQKILKEETNDSSNTTCK